MKRHSNRDNKLEMLNLNGNDDDNILKTRNVGDEH